MNELLTEKRLGRVQELFDSVPKPKGFVPKNGLPMWSKMPLDSKIPTVPTPDGLIVYSRALVGDPLRVKITNEDFVLSDGSGVEFPYEALHDENLKSFLRSEVTRKHLKKVGLMTEEGEEICPVDVFNEYRRYLRSVHVTLVNKERALRDALAKERRDLALAKEFAERDAEKERRRLERMAKNEGARARKQMEENLKKEELKRKIQRRMMHEEWLEKFKREQQINRIARSKARDNKIRECIAVVAQLVRQRNIKTMRKWREYEKKYRRREKREKTMRKQVKDQNVPDMQQDKKYVKDTVNQAIHSLSATGEREANLVELLEETKLLLDKQAQLPLDVKAVIDQMLNKSVYYFLRNKVKLMLSDIIRGGIQTIELEKAKKISQGKERVCSCLEYSRRSISDKYEKSQFGQLLLNAVPSQTVSPFPSEWNFVWEKCITNYNHGFLIAKFHMNPELITNLWASRRLALGI
ncbi:inner centromere protein [Hetaerina americana]|uniref:inner centromere protein n=1 Tax=Hetaerina americana TaxID=62018 RepID=UPI003A7F1DE7